MKDIHTQPRAKNPGMRFALGSHRNLTILLVSLILFVAACVYFVNTVVLTPRSDDTYRQQAENDAKLITFNTSLLKKAQDFTANANSTALPAGRVNPFGS